MGFNSAKFENLSCRVILIVIELDRWKTREALLGIASCHASAPGPTRLADLNRVWGARPYTGTLYLLKQTWIYPSLITIST